MLFDLRTEKCPSCGKDMIQKAPYGLFPSSCNVNQDAQIKKNGVVYVSNMTIDDKKICEECKDAGKASFICALCGQRRSPNEEEESFGDPAEYLCSICYNTVPAKEWDDKCEALIGEHRYDFE